MAAPRVLVLRAPGTNCDVETGWIFDHCGGQSNRVHLFRVLERPELLQDYQILCVPGGFSYGDDVGAGVIFGAQLRSHLAEAIQQFLTADKLVLGICNGFQVLMRSRILPGGGETWPPRPETEPDATLTWNENGRYTCRWVKLQVPADTPSVFLKGIRELELPMAHAEGRIAVRSEAVLTNWKARRQIAVTYDPHDNPNGSAAGIAGLCDPTGRVLGLMPHPERFIHATQHPQWTRRRGTVSPEAEGAGAQLFRNAVNYFL
ncbi:MAG: phosphoribosylformylglycinamidine synthase subunit PurQ [Planctomycetaceae bacterium]